MNTLFKKHQWLLPIFGLAIIITYLVIATWNIQVAGFHYDEILFINVALGGKLDGFIAWQFKGITLFLMAYIGSLKAYIYLPILALFGVSYESIRIPMIILALVATLGLALVLYKKLGKRITFFYLFFTLLNPAFIFQSRFDIGPSVIEFTIIQMLLTLLLYFRETKKSFILLAFPILLGLGTFNKLNFIWVVNSFVFIFIIFYWKEFITYFKNKDIINPVILVILLLALYAGFLLITIKFQVSGGFSLSAILGTVSLKFQNLITTISGTGFIRFHFIDIPFLVDVFLVILLCIPFLYFFVDFSKIFTYTYFVKKVKAQCIEFSEVPSLKIILVLFLVLIFAQILVTKQAIATWHPAQLLAIWNLLIAIVVSEYITKKKLLLAGVGLIGIFWLGISFYTFRGFDNPKLLVWTPKINELSSYTKSQNADIRVLDWGIYNQLIAFDYIQGKYHEDFWTIDGLTDTELDTYVITHYLQKDTHIIFFDASYKIPKSTVRRVEQSLNNNGRKLVVTKTISNESGTIFVIARVE